MNKLSSVFVNVDEEFTRYILKPEISNLPNWFDGKVLRVGPAKFEYGNIKLNHWFDGLAMLYSFRCNDREIYFSNRYLRSEQYLAATKGRIKFDEFGTIVPYKFARIRSLIKTILGVKVEKPSCNVNILKVKDSLLATSEVTTMIEFDKDDLHTLNEFRFCDKIKGQFSCAHPQIDPITKEQFNFVVDISKKCKYTIYKIAKNSSQRTKIYEFYDNQFIYNHTLFLTESYVVLYLGPLRANPLDFLTKPVSEVISHDPNAKCKLLLINRKTHKVSILDISSMVFLHSVNAFEQNNKIYLDFIEYTDNLEPYKKFYFKNIESNDCRLKTQLTRMIVDIGRNTIEKSIITAPNVEFPRINEKYLVKNYRYAYLAKRTDQAEFFNSIIKIDLSNNDMVEYCFGNDFVSEPIFIANPQAQTEDDGLIFVNVIDTDKKLSYIVYLNATDLSLVYKAYLPILIPPALHGVYLK
ncbi:retinal pigment epithelial membrane family protein [Francisella philomiragia]|uniref:carotenoid oxygenase family protein n=1 Tax=Francisella philomiragia TaxID=28110 RepID=UPI0005A567B0|nr:carotenoid oxygenase family protein [Francisella philomiragia]AJI54953.1 retinal pigment epithelial membrane family protein [Francisella philomiragia]MBK2252623.1 carotenoid oxygenase family protein [Francisella philomiragia]